MEKITDNKKANMIVFISIIVYFASYITRINYTAILVEFIADQGVTKTMASLVTTVLCITYGTGQLLSGYLGDKVSPVKLIYGGLAMAIAMNLVMPVIAPNITLMSIVWGINGVAQAFMWPPIVKILSTVLTDVKYAKSIPFIAMGSAGGTIAVYLFAPLIITVAGWRYVFIVSAVLAAVATIMCAIGFGKLLKGFNFIQVSNIKTVKESDGNGKRSGSGLIAIIPVIIITIALQGMLRDGISTWTPNLLSETFNLKSTVSMLTSVAIPLFHLIFDLFAYSILRIFKNDVFYGIIGGFGICVAAFLILFTFSNTGVWLTILMLAISTGFISVINIMQTCYLPGFFSGQNKVSTYSGLFNFSTYIGSAVSTYLFAAVSEALGWDKTVLFWAGFALLGVILTFVCRFYMKRRVETLKVK